MMRYGEKSNATMLSSGFEAFPGGEPGGSRAPWWRRSKKIHSKMAVRRRSKTSRSDASLASCCLVLTTMIPHPRLTKLTGIGRVSWTAGAG
uniref:Uncharacterized protein n=1 Tax=Arundo donax TaxID=35708 RepID=A0A0A9GVD0_ARUDO